MIELSIYQRNNSAVKQTNNNKTTKPTSQTNKPKNQNLATIYVQTLINNQVLQKW